MYVDPGADITLIPFSVGKLVGLRRSRRDKLHRIFGVGRSSVPVLLKRVSMRIGSSEFEARVAWSQVEDVPLLLGRMDVFTRFNITFREKLGLTTFQSIADCRSGWNKSPYQLASYPVRESSRHRV